MLLEPGWREDDFKRLKDSAINSLRVGLRGNNDEELGKEVLLSELYRGTPYGHYSVGTVSALQKITLDDLKQFYKQHYTQSQPDRRHRRRLHAGVSGSPEEGFRRAAGEGLRRPRLAIHPPRDRAHARFDRGEEHALGGVFLRLPHRRQARRSGLSRAAGDAILFRPASR